MSWNWSRRVDYVMGIVLLSITMIIQIVFSLLELYYGIPGFVSMASRSGSYSDFCRRIDYTGTCDLYLTYTWLFSRIPRQLLIVIYLASSILIYFFAGRILNSDLLGGLVTLLYSTSPVLMYISRLDYMGVILTSLLPLISSLSLLYGFLNRDSVVYLSIGVFLYALSLLHPVSLTILVFTSIVILVDYVRGVLSKRRVVVLLIMSSTAVISSIATWRITYTIDILAIPTLVLATGVVSLTLIGLRFKSIYSYRFVMSIILVVLVILANSATTMYTTTMDSTTLDLRPIHIYGLPGFLAIPALVVYTKTKKRVLEDYLVIGVLTSILLSIINQVNILVTSLFLSLASTWFLGWVISSIDENIRVSRSPWRILVYFTISALITTSLYSSIHVSSYLRDHGLVVVDEVEEIKIERGITLRVQVDFTEITREMSRVLRDTSSGSRVLLVSNWDHVSWIQRLLVEEGIDIYLLAHPHGSDSGKSLLARIMTSRWDVSRYILNKLKLEIGVDDVYILLVSTYTMDLANKTHLGFPNSITFQAGQYPTLVYEAYGDLYRLVEFLDYANKSLEDYLHVIRGFKRIQPLRWNIRGRDMLLPQLLVLTLREMGYLEIYNQLMIYNQLIDHMPLNTSIEGFKPIYTRSIPLGEVDIAYYGNYKVYYVVALIKLE